MSLGVVAGALFGAVGLVPFAPYLGLMGRAGALRQWVELLARPFGEWDLAIGAATHRWLPLAGALPVIAVAAVFLGAKRVRPWIGGFAVGTAALATQLAISGDAAFALGALGMRVYLVASVIACAWVARVALDQRRSG